MPNIHVGEQVLSRNEHTGQLSFQQVLNQYNNPYKQTVYIDIEDTAGNTQTIVSNKIHPFFTKINRNYPLPPSSEGHDYQGEIDNAQWVDASNLKAGYQLLSENGEWQVVQSVRQTNEPLSAYNLTVNNDHTYFVTGSDSTYGVWVHNSCQILGSFERMGSGSIKIIGGDSKRGMQHILERHSADQFLDHSKGDLFPVGTTEKQILDAIQSVYSKGTRVSDPNKVMQTFEKRIRINGEVANYRLLVDTTKNDVVTFFKIGQ